MAASIIGAIRVALGLDSADFDSGVASAQAGAARLGGSLQKLDRPMTQVQRSSGRTGAAFQNASFQLQDLVVQIQGGTSASRALSMQLPQLLGGFGAFGAALGLASGLLVPFAAKMLQLAPAGDAAATSLGRLVALLPSFSGAGSAISDALTLVASNLDRIAIYAGTAAAIFAGRYVAGLVAAAVATGGLSGALLVLRGAIIRTGLGALIVAAGEIVYQFTRLVQGAGSFGAALGLLKDVAVEVWDRIKEAFGGIVPAMKAAAAGMAQEFYYKLADMVHQFNAFLGYIVEGINNTFNTQIRLPMGLIRAYGALNDAGNAAGESAAAAAAEASAAWDAATAPLASLTALMDTAANAGDGVALSFGGGSGSDGMGGGGGAAGAARALREQVDAVKKALDKLLEGMTPAQKQALAFQDAMIDAGMSAEELGKAKADTLIQGIDGISTAFGDFIAGGLRDFKGFAKSILASFRSMIAQMIATAAKNRIMLNIQTGMQNGTGIGGWIARTFGGGGAGSTAGNAAGAAGSAGGVMAGIGGALGTIGSGLWAGASGVVGGLASGGLAGAGASLSASLAGASTGMAGLATAIGAVAVPVLAVVAAFSFFRKRVKEVDQLLAADLTANRQAFWDVRMTQTSRFWGLSKSSGSDWNLIGGKDGKALAKPFDDLLGNIRDMGRALNITGVDFSKWSYQIRRSVKGLTDDQKAQVLAEELGKAGDSFARFIGVGRRYIREGETSTQALERLVTSLKTANSIMKTLGGTMFDVSLLGAKAAQRFIDALGGLENAGRQAEFYFQNFYSLPERIKVAGQQFRSAFAQLGLDMDRLPTTMKGFKALVDQLMRAGKNGKAGALIDLADEFKAWIDLRNEAKPDTVKPIDTAVRAALNPNDFRSRLDYLRADSRRSAAGGAAAQAKALSKPKAVSAEDKEMLRILKGMRDESKQLLKSIAADVRKTATVNSRWDDDGLPSERT